jgi:hypothetical protein
MDLVGQHHVKYPILGALHPPKGVTIHCNATGHDNACQEALYPRLSATDHRMVQEAG